MEIAEEYGISIHMDERRAVVFDEWMDTDCIAVDGSELTVKFLESHNENLRRAICEVFLMMDV